MTDQKNESITKQSPVEWLTYIVPTGQARDKAPRLAPTISSASKDSLDNVLNSCYNKV